MSLLTSKSRVAPLKQVSIPRLELCGAVLLVKLMKKVTDALKIDNVDIHYFTDSTIVLAWIKKEPRELKTFVANRVSTINQLSSCDQWHHIASNQNPADLPSRGMEPGKLKDYELWLNPETPVLSESSVQCDDVLEGDEQYLKEFKSTTVSATCVLTFPTETLTVINNGSSYSKTVRTIDWCKRFIQNCRNASDHKKGPLSASELSDALKCIIRNVQRTVFVKEIKCLENGTSIPNNSKILSLSPFLDKEGILRV